MWSWIPGGAVIGTARRVNGSAKWAARRGSLVPSDSAVVIGVLGVLAFVVLGLLT